MDEKYLNYFLRFFVVIAFFGSPYDLKTRLLIPRGFQLYKSEKLTLFRG